LLVKQTKKQNKEKWLADQFWTVSVSITPDHTKDRLKFKLPKQRENVKASKRRYFEATLRLKISDKIDALDF